MTIKSSRARLVTLVRLMIIVIFSRRQLAFLEVSLNQAEERMKEESDKLVKFYSEKIHWLEEHHQLYKNMAEDNLRSVTDRHKAENEMTLQQHSDNARILQEHHVALMENIR